MFPRIFYFVTLLYIYVSLVSSSPAPAPVAEPEPIDATIANVIATNENLGCSGPSGCVATQNSTAAAEIFAASGAAHSMSTPGAASALVAAAAALAGGLSVAGLL